MGGSSGGGGVGMFRIKIFLRVVDLTHVFDVISY